jgi:hypothetical protein
LTAMFSVILFSFYSQYVGCCKGHDTQAVFPEINKMYTADTRQDIHNWTLKSQFRARKCLDASSALVSSIWSFSQTALLSTPGIKDSDLHNKKQLLIQCMKFFLPSSLLPSTQALIITICFTTSSQPLPKQLQY